MDTAIIAAIITASVSLAVAIIGFAFSVINLRFNYKNSLALKKDDLRITKMSEMPYEVLSILDLSMNPQAFDINRYKKMMNTIYSYGSPDAIKICAEMNQAAFDNAGKPKDSRDNNKMIALYMLLATQIKADVTQIEVSPKELQQIRLTDYAKHKDALKQANNEYVKTLGLSNSLLIK